MRLCLNEATTAENSCLERDVFVYADAGFELIELRTPCVSRYLEKHSISQFKELFSHIRPFAINALEHINFKNGKAWDETLFALDRMLLWAEEIGCDLITCVPSLRPDSASRAEIVDETAAALSALREHISGRARLGFEFLGFPSVSAPTLDLANDIIRVVNRPDVGLVLDTFHFYAMDSALSDIAKIDVSRFFALHLCDCEAISEGRPNDSHRLWPGEGAIPLNRILPALQAIGFDGVASVELFRPEYYRLDPADAARIAYRKAYDMAGKYWVVR